MAYMSTATYLNCLKKEQLDKDIPIIEMYNVTVFFLKNVYFRLYFVIKQSYNY